MASQQLDDLKLSEEQAEDILEKAIEHGAYDSEMPEGKKDKLAAADEIVAFAVDAWVNDNIRPDDEDAEVAASGKQLQDLLELAGVEIDDDGNITLVEYDEPEAEEEAEEDDNGGEEGEEDEAPFNPDDYIEGYSELSMVSKLKAIKGLDLDNEDDISILNAIYDWENEQEKPSSRVLNWIDENLGEPEGEEEPEAEEEEEEPEEEEAEEENAEPWEGYDKATATQIKAVLNNALEDEDEPLSKEQVEYVLEYEQGRQKPPPRKRIIEYCETLIEQFDNGGDEEPEAEEEPAPPKRRGKAKAKPKPAAKAEPEADDSLVTITLNGDTLGEFDAASVLNVVAAIADQVENGATSLALEMS